MAGRFVRIPFPQSESVEDIHSAVESDDEEPSSAGAEQIIPGAERASPTAYQSVRMSQEEQEPEWPTAHCLKVLENAVVNLANVLLEKEQKSKTLQSDNPNWGYVGGNPVGNGDSQQGGLSFRMDQLRPFPKDVPSNRLWEEWRKYLKNFEIAASLHQITEPGKLAKVLFLAIGDDLQGIVEAARLRPALEGPDCYDTFVRNVDRHLRSMTDTTTEHESFMAMRQEVGESAVAYHARLVDRARLCDYGQGGEDRFVHSQLIKGLRDKEIAKAARIFNYDTNFIVQAATRSEAYEPVAGSSSSQDVLAVGHENRTKSGSLKRPFTQKDRVSNEEKRGAVNPTTISSRGSQTNRQRSFGKGRRNKCSRCNRWSHENPQQCPALELECFECGIVGHFAATCRNKKKGSAYKSEYKREDDQRLTIHALTLEDVLVNCSVGHSGPIRFLIDSGADVNIIGGTDWMILESELAKGLVELRPVSNENRGTLTAYATDLPMAVLCSFESELAVLGSGTSPVRAEFIVVPKGRRSILGRSTASEVDLLRVGLSINACDTDEILFPKMPGVKVKFNIDQAVTPVRNAYYNVPAAFRDAARKRLREMESQGIIERVREAPRWISGMSAVPKGQNDFRLVVNMRAPNRAIKREYYRFPLMQEMKVKLHGAKYFSKLDLTNAYYHLELSKESRELTTFMAENGMFRFTRLMFGVNCAPEIFQREMCRILENIPNVIVYMDDILVSADTLEELRTTVARVMQILRVNNLTLNPSKCQLDQERITFLGHDLDARGFHIEESKVKHIRQFRQPTTHSELRSFLGLGSFVSPYIKDYANMAGPLWNVATTKSWVWGDAQSKAFELIKSSITQCTSSLGFFSDLDKTILFTDASPTALGAVLVQEDGKGVSRIISFASKGLTSTEKKYPQNQREALSAVWAVEYFSFYLLGRHFTLKTDAKGVAFILNRTREDSKRALTRADGWALRLSPYSYDVEYVKGSENIADPSSRLYQGNDAPFDDVKSPWEIVCLEANAVEFLTEGQICIETARDDILLEVSKALEDGNWSKDLRRFQAVANDLNFERGILTKKGCAVIPTVLRKEALEVAHKGHPHAAKLKSILRERVWWPGMATDAENWVKSCSVCSLNGMPEKPTPMRRILAPKTVWETIAIDFNGPYAKFGGILILVIIDYRSRYISAHPVKSTSFECTKKALDEVFNREGFPRFMKTDNGPPFNGEEFKQYCVERSIQTVFSTPLFPQQNGLVENSMKLINKAMSAAVTNGSSYSGELLQAVQAHNAAAHCVTGVPPEELLSGRRIRRRLPLLRSSKVLHDDEVIDDRDFKAKMRGKVNEDAKRGARKCRVQPGDTVVISRQSRMKGDSRFLPTRHTVVAESNGNLVLVDNQGGRTKRHVTQTKKVQAWRDRSEPRESHGKSGESSLGPQRPIRQTKAPSHLQDYIYMVDKD